MYLIHFIWDWLGLIVITFITLEVLFYFILRIELINNAKYKIISGCLFEKVPAIPDSYSENGEWYIKYVNEAKIVFNNLKWSPYIYWIPIPFKGSYININKSGNRKTFYSNNESQFVIHMYGGSTMWGTGSRDEGTIPSFLAQKLSTFGVKANIINMGQIGYVNTQEMLAFLLEYQRNNIPNMVIFYDGINEIQSAIQNGTAGLTHNEANRAKEFNQSLGKKLKNTILNFSSIINAYRLLKINATMNKRSLIIKKEQSQGNDTCALLARKIVDCYKNNIKIIQNHCTVNNIVCLFYWQPTLFDKITLSPYEEQMLEIRKIGQNLHLKTLELIQQEITKLENCYELSSIFSSYSNSCYIDPWHHLNEEANRIIACKISEDVNKYFIPRASSKIF